MGLVVKETILSDLVIVEMGMKVWTDAKKCIGYHGFLVLFGIVWCMFSFWTCIVYLCALHYNFAGHRRHYYDAFQRKVCYWKTWDSFNLSTLGEGEIPNIIMDFADL